MAENRKFHIAVGKALRGHRDWATLLHEYPANEIVDCLLDTRRCLESKRLLKLSALAPLLNSLDVKQLCRIYLDAECLDRYRQGSPVLNMVDAVLFDSGNRFGDLPLADKLEWYRYYTDTLIPIHSHVIYLLWEMADKIPWAKDVLALATAVKLVASLEDNQIWIHGDLRRLRYDAFRALRQLLPKTE